MRSRIWETNPGEVAWGRSLAGGYEFQERWVAGALVPERWFPGDHSFVVAGSDPGTGGDIVRRPAAGEGLAGKRDGDARGHIHLGDCMGADQAPRGPFALFERLFEDLRLVPEGRAGREVDDAGGLVL